MRPNIDVPHETHGAVKDYAKEHDISVSQAYRRLLEKTLLASRRGRGPEERGADPDIDDRVHQAVEEGDPIPDGGLRASDATSDVGISPCQLAIAWYGRRESPGEMAERYDVDLSVIWFLMNELGMGREATSPCDRYVSQWQRDRGWGAW